MNRSIYLDAQTDKKFKERAETLGVPVGELTQTLIHIYLNTPQSSVGQLNTCLDCQYYKLGQTEVLEQLKRLKKVSDLFLGGLLKKEN
jgi:hypothetical protein